MRALAVLACAVALATGASACGGGGGGEQATSVSTIPTQPGTPTQKGTSAADNGKVAKHPDTSNSVGSGGLGY